MDVCTSFCTIRIGAKYTNHWNLNCIWLLLVVVDTHPREKGKKWEKWHMTKICVFCLLVWWLRHEIRNSMCLNRARVHAYNYQLKQFAAKISPNHWNLWHLHSHSYLHLTEIRADADTHLLTQSQYTPNLHTHSTYTLEHYFCLFGISQFLKLKAHWRCCITAHRNFMFRWKQRKYLKNERFLRLRLCFSIDRGDGVK